MRTFPLLFLLAGCVGGDSDTGDDGPPTDRDADGFTSDVDCDDNDSTEFPGQTWYPDTDLDGFGDASAAPAECSRASTTDVLDNTDCDDADADEFPGQTWYADADSDGFGDPASSTTCERAASNDVSRADDCDDTDADEFPGQQWYPDADDDGYGDGSTTPSACSRAAAGDVSNGDDCDDTRAELNPGVIWYADSDRDGYGDPNQASVCAPSAATDVPNAEDCDDTDSQQNPGVTWYPDSDGDGYGTGAGTVCLRPSGTAATRAGDCDDSAAAANPDGTELPGNGLDDDCVDGDADSSQLYALLGTNSFQSAMLLATIQVYDGGWYVADEPIALPFIGTSSSTVRMASTPAGDLVIGSGTEVVTFTRFNAQGVPIAPSTFTPQDIGIELTAIRSGLDDADVYVLGNDTSGTSTVGMIEQYSVNFSGTLVLESSTDYPATSLRGISLTDTGVGMVVNMFTSPSISELAIGSTGSIRVETTHTNSNFSRPANIVVSPTATRNVYRVLVRDLDNGLFGFVYNTNFSPATLTVASGSPYNVGFGSGLALSPIGPTILTLNSSSVLAYNASTAPFAQGTGLSVNSGSPRALTISDTEAFIGTSSGQLLRATVTADSDLTQSATLSVVNATHTIIDLIHAP